MKKAIAMFAILACVFFIFVFLIPAQETGNVPQESESPGIVATNDFAPFVEVSGNAESGAIIDTETIVAKKFVEESAVSPESAQEPYPSDAELVNLNFEGVDIRDILKIIAERSGVNIIVGEDVKALVTVQMKDTPWEKALDTILRTYNLTSIREGNLIRVMTLEKMREESEKVPLVTRIVMFNFACVADIRSSLARMLSSRGSMEVNSRTNSLIITDVPENIAKVEQIANQLDIRTPQVMIEAIMCTMKVTDELELGINWTIIDKDNKYRAGTSLTAPSYIGYVTYTRMVAGMFDLASTLSLWEQDKKVNILAAPRIMTLDNQQATIELIEEIPYTELTQSTQSSSALQTTSFKQAGIKLYVTPHITLKDNFILMTVQTEHSYQSGTTGTGQPVIDTRKANTNLMVRDGETIVIGGLRRKEDTKVIDKVPILGDVPIFGFLFRRTDKVETDTDLLIFVTPRMISEPHLAIKERLKLEEFERFSAGMPAAATVKIKRGKNIISETPIEYQEEAPALTEEPFPLKCIQK